MRRGLLAAAFAAALPGLGPVERRVPVDPSAAAWRAIGRVQTELGGRCTGFLVGPHTVLTAAHCLYRQAPAAFVQPGSVHFLLGYDRGRYVAHARVRHYQIGPGFSPAEPAQTRGADWAALTLDADIGSPGRILKLAPAQPGQPVQLGGYGQDRAEVIDADLHCRIVRTGVDPGGRALVEHDCAGTRGTSGAPLLMRVGDEWVAAGVQVAAVAGAPGGVAVAASGIKPALERGM